MASRPSLHAGYEHDYPQEGTLLGMVTPPISVSISLDWMFDDSENALRALEVAYLDVKRQVEVTLKDDNAAATEGDLR